MDVTQIPFAKHIGIEKKDEGTLQLESSPSVLNHIETIHASAQFALAETQSGLYLQIVFPELEDKVVGLLRGATVKYKNPALTSIYASSSIEESIKEKFLTTLHKKSRASITVTVKVRDSDDVLTMMGEYNWFVQKL